MSKKDWLYYKYIELRDSTGWLLKRICVTGRNKFSIGKMKAMLKKKNKGTYTQQRRSQEALDTFWYPKDNKENQS